MVRQKIELYCALPILSTYLGHASIEATERYVRFTAEVYPEILNTVVLFHLFPILKGTINFRITSRPGLRA
jgi:integrase/recombinase XerD